MLQKIFEMLKASYLCFKTLKNMYTNIFLRGISTYTSRRRVIKDEDISTSYFDVIIILIY